MIKISKIIILACILISCSKAFAEDSNSQDPANWPKNASVGDAAVTFYQPQIEQFDGQQLDFIMAVGITQDQNTTYGTVTAQCAANVDQTTNLVSCENINMTNMDFPTGADQQALSQIVQQSLGQQPFELPLQQIQSGLKQTQINQTKNQTVKLQSAPPQIYVANTPSVLVLIDGDPQLKNMDNNPDLMQV